MSLPDRRFCPYDGIRKVLSPSGLVWGPYCIGHAEDFVRQSRGGEITAPKLVGPAQACQADWVNSAEVPG